MYSVFFNPNSLRPDKCLDSVPVIVSKVYVGIVGTCAELWENYEIWGISSKV